MEGAPRVKVYRCNSCDEVFAQNSSLSRHKKQKHRDEGPSCSLNEIKCPVCGTYFSRKDSLLRHQKKTHRMIRENKCKDNKSNSLRYSCLKCSRNFQLPADLKRHETSHHVESLPGFDKLRSVLPDDGYQYDYLSFSLCKTGFQAKFEISDFQVNQMNDWLNKFKDKNFITLRLSRSPPKMQKLSTCLLQKEYRCHHNTRCKTSAVKSVAKRLSKNTNCPAMLRLRITKTRRQNKEKEPLKLIVFLKHTHNHPLRAASSLRFRDPSSDVREKFIAMFQSGLSPSRSLEIHKQHLQVEYGDEYFLVAADRKFCPDSQWVFKLYYKTFKKFYGEDANGVKAIESLKAAVSAYNERLTSRQAVFKMMPDNKNFYVCLVTPLMKRASSLRSAGEMMFVDSSGSVDRFGCKVFILLTNSCVGGLPVGCIMYSSETADILEAAFTDLLSLHDGDSFGSRGSDGPSLIMTDDCSAERKALSAVFPKANLLLCIFHILQAAWRWLWNGAHNIDKYDRPQLLSYLKTMMYAATSDDLLHHYQTAPEVVSKYPHFQKYVRNLYNRRKEWALCFRIQQITRGQNTNNLCEAAMRVLKDKVLLRTRAYSPSQLFDFLEKDFNSVYERKLISSASYRPEMYIRKKELKEANTDFTDLKVESHSSNIFIIVNTRRKSSYTVDMNVYLCECFVGRSGASCKHILFTCEAAGLSKPTELTASQREQLHYIAVGHNNCPPDWYIPLDFSQTPQRMLMEEEDVEVGAQENVGPDNLKSPLPTSLGKAEEHENAPTRTSEEPVTPLSLNLRGLFNKLFDMVDSKPEVFSGAVAAAEKRLSHIQTEASLVSLLFELGKCSSSGRKLSGLRKIPVQTTAIRRRKTACGGRRPVRSGRPVTKMQAEHNYSDNGSRPPAAPHSISECVSRNVSLPKL